jgi:hypothetical protein
MGALGVEGDVDGGAAVDGAFGPGPAAVAVDDAPDGGQPMPVPGNSAAWWSGWSGWNRLPT